MKLYREQVVEYFCYGLVLILFYNIYLASINQDTLEVAI